MMMPKTTRPDRPYNPLANGQNNTAFTGSNGVPLGGIGAGCVELLPDGRLANFCTNNNRHRNERIETMPGTFFACAASDAETGMLRVLQSESSLPLGREGRTLLLHPDELTYDGCYPQAAMSYTPHQFPLEVSLRAHGTVVPGDLVASSMPAAVFTFTLKNTGPRPVWGSVLFSWENIAGCLHGIFPEGRADIRQVREGERVLGLEFRSPEGCRPNQAGAHAIYIDAPAAAEVTAARYNTWDTGIILAEIEDTGAFSATAWGPTFFSESRYTGALACKVPIAPGATCEVTFTLAWYYPTYRVAESELVGKFIGVCDQGHMYCNHFADVHDVARAALARRREICERIAHWHDAVFSSSLPEWMGRMLLNNLYVLSPDTLWAKNGNYSLMETPYGPMMGTLDQRFYSSISTALFFPELEREELALFAQTKHPEDRGRVYHDLGNLRFDDPKTGTTAKKWTDLNPKFVLMAYRYYLWTNDRATIEALWLYMIDMMAYSRTQDTDGDGLPNNDDRSTTYDDWAFFGANSYASTLWVAALAAFREMARLLGCPADWAPYAELYTKAAQAVESRLWDEELGYYRLYNDDLNPVFTASAGKSAVMVSAANGAVNQGAVPSETMGDHPRINRDCHDGQLVGQWYADMLGLGKLFDEAHIKSAVQQIYQRNATPRGMRKGVTPEGAESANPPSSHWWSEAGQCWPGYEVGHYAALAIYQGEVADALTTVERIYQQVHVDGGMAWNQPLRWNIDSGMTYGWGCDRYMNSPVVWHVYLALTGLLLNRPEKSLTLRPHLLPGDTSMDVPLFTPGNWGRLIMAITPEECQITLTFTAPEPVRMLTLAAGEYTTAQIDGMMTKYTVEETCYGSARELCIRFAEDVHIGVAGMTIVMR